MKIFAIDHLRADGPCRVAGAHLLLMQFLAVKLLSARISVGRAGESFEFLCILIRIGLFDEHAFDQLLAG